MSHWLFSRYPSNWIRFCPIFFMVRCALVAFFLIWYQAVLPLLQNVASRIAFVPWSIQPCFWIMVRQTPCYSHLFCLFSPRCFRPYMSSMSHWHMKPTDDSLAPPQPHSWERSCILLVAAPRLSSTSKLRDASSIPKELKKPCGVRIETYPLLRGVGRWFIFIPNRCWVRFQISTDINALIYRPHGLIRVRIKCVENECSCAWCQSVDLQIHASIMLCPNKGRSVHMRTLI